MSAPLVYLILGAAGSGRREVVEDLALFGLDPEDRPKVFVAERHLGDSEESLGEMGEKLSIASWSMIEGNLQIEAEPEVTHLFIVSDGLTDPIDLVEALKDWLPFTPFELGRIITVVNCALLDANASLRRWYDACIHFSDVVLLNRREGLSSKWVSAFKARLRQESLPCHVELVKKGRVANPALVLYPEPRRISLVFDDEEHLYPDDDDTSDEEAVIRMVDPYFERLLSGRRVKELPDIRKFLESGQG
jgi:hypothetical protein